MFWKMISFLLLANDARLANCLRYLGAPGLHDPRVRTLCTFFGYSIKFIDVYQTGSQIISRKRIEIVLKSSCQIETLCESVFLHPGDINKHDPEKIGSVRVIQKIRGEKLSLLVFEKGAHIKNLLHDLSAFLLDISEGGKPIEPSVGLCRNIVSFAHSYHNVFEKLPDCFWSVLVSFYKDWPPFSGDKDYPIPFPGEPLDKAGECYVREGSKTALYEGEYGNLRRQLAAYLAKRISDHYLT